MAQLTLERLSKDFGTIRAVDGITITVEDGEFLALLGPFRLRQDNDPASHCRL